MWEFWGPIWKAARLYFFPDPLGVNNVLSNHKVLSKDLKSGRLLGKGVSGIVYETRWNGHRYARKDFLQVQRDVFEREAVVLVRLKIHPNIVQTHCWTIDKRSCSLVLEFMDDNLLNVIEKRKASHRQTQNGLSPSESSQKSHLIDLHKFIEELRNEGTNESPPVSPFNIREAVSIIQQIAEGMRFLHENGVAHGDLKPRNILVTSVHRYSYSFDQHMDILVKVADFGLIRTKKKSMSLVSPKARKLEIARWSAPELFEDLNLLRAGKVRQDDSFTDSDSDSDASDKASDANADNVLDTVAMMEADVYSFALTCSQILTGEEPYRGLGLKELVEEVSINLRPRLPPNSHKSLDSLIRQCWGRKAGRPNFRRILLHLNDNVRREINASQAIETLEYPSPSKGDPNSAPSSPSEYSFSENRSTPILHPSTPILRPSTPILHDDDVMDFLKTLPKNPKWGHFFKEFDDMKVYKKIGVDSQAAEIFEAEWFRGKDGKMVECLLKVYRGLNFSVSIELLKFFISSANEADLGRSRLVHILGGTILQVEPFRDSRFAILMERCWGDLRQLIDMEILRNKSKRGPPFRQEVAKEIMQQIAEGMEELHRFGIIHRDLKSFNVLIKDIDSFHSGSVSCRLIGFEAPEWGIGTGFWRAPEVLHQLKLRLNDSELWRSSKMEFTKAGDVYGYAMTCYEILTGCIPFQNERFPNYHIVLSGERPSLSEISIHSELKDLMTRCWDPDPSKRPIFQEIVVTLRNITFSEETGVPRTRSSSLEGQAIIMQEAEASSSKYSADDEYVTAWWRWLEQLRSKRGNKVDVGIMAKLWKHLTVMNFPSSALDLVHVAVYQNFQRLIEQDASFASYLLRPWVKPSFFEEFGDGELVMGKKIGEGGQAEIFNATFHGQDEDVLKVFKPDFSIADLEGHWTARIPQVRHALEAIKNVCTMSNSVCVNKHQCKRIADRFSAVGKGLGWDIKLFDGGNYASDLKDYPAFDREFDELLTVLRKGEALVSSYVDSKGISSMVSRTINREAFIEIHKELEFWKDRMIYYRDREPGQVIDFESWEYEDAERDLKELLKVMPEIKVSE